MGWGSEGIVWSASWREKGFGKRLADEPGMERSEGKKYMRIKKRKTKRNEKKNRRRRNKQKLIRFVGGKLNMELGSKKKKKQKCIKFNQKQKNKKKT